MTGQATNRLLVAMLVGIGAGILLGGLAPQAGKAVQILGELFLRALLMLVIPLVMASMIVGISGLGDVRRLGRLGALTLLYFMATTALAVLVGLVLVSMIQPGTIAPGPEDILRPPGESQVLAEQLANKAQTVGELLRQVLLSLVPNNLFSAMAQAEVLPLIIFSLVFGAVLTTLGERGAIVIRFFEGVNEAVMGIVHLLMWVAPIGIGALIAGRLGEAGGFSGFGEELLRVSRYAATVLLALAIHAILTLALILWFIGKRSVWLYARNMGTALTTAFSTGSSSATLPMTIEGVIEENKVSARIGSFVLPLGATINMNGTALYEAIAAVFIAQVYGIHLGFGQLIIVFLTATLAAIGAAGIPEAGLVTMVIVLKAVGLPLEGISLLLVIDWFLDRCRTAVNVWGDAVGAAVIDRVENNEDSGTVRER